MKNFKTVLAALLMVCALPIAAHALDLSASNAAELVEGLDKLVETKEIFAAPKVKISTMAALGYTVEDIEIKTEASCSMLITLRKGSETERFLFVLVKPGSRTSSQGKFGIWSTKEFSEFTPQYQIVSKACMRIGQAK